MAGTGALAAARQRRRTLRRTTAGPQYNYPKIWYMRVDGDVVELDGDPQSIAHYTQKGYTPLSEPELDDWIGPVVDPRRGIRDRSQGAQYLEMKERLTRAAVITEIRELMNLPTAKEKVTLPRGLDLSRMPEEGLHALRDEVKKAIGMERVVLDAKSLGYDFAIDDLDTPEALGLVTADEMLDVAEAQGRYGGGGELVGKIQESRRRYPQHTVSSVGPPLGD